MNATDRTGVGDSGDWIEDDRMDKGCDRRVRLMAAACLMFCVLPGRAAADFLEPMPRYAHARQFRGDASLHAIAFADEQTGLAVGDRGTLLLTRDGGTTWHLRDSGVDCQLCDVLWWDEQRAVVIGGGYDRITGLSRGAVLWTEDGGRRWQRADDGELPRLTDLRIGADGRTLLAIGDWSAASGTRAFASSDGGRTWQGEDPADELVAAATEPTSADRRDWTETSQAPAPIRGRCRVGANELWAVGDHGCILHSADGGRTWQARRGGERQTSLLIVSRRPADVPWPVIGNEAFEFRQRVAVLVAESQPGDFAAGSEQALVRQAAVTLGGAAADSLTASGMGPVDDSQRQPQGADRWLTELDDWLAMHRPLVVVLDRELEPSVRESFRRLAIERGTARVVTYELGQQGDSMLHAGALLPRSGVLARDLWEDALQLVAPGDEPGESVALRRVHDVAGVAPRGDSVTGGLRRPDGCELAAEIPPAPRRQLQTAKARLSESRRLDRLFGTAGDPETFSSSLQMLVAQTASEDRFRLLWRAFRKARTQVDRSREALVLEQIAKTMDETSVGDWSQLRVEVMRRSEEWSSLRESIMESARAGEVATAADVVPVSPFKLPEGSRLEQGDGAVRQASATSPLRVAVSQPLELNRERQSEESREREVDLVWEFHPAVLVARDAFRRHGSDGELQPAEKPSADLRRVTEADPGSGWSRLFTADRGQLVIAPRAPTPPRLDERVDDPCWQQAAPQSLKAGIAGEPATIQMAYDDDYVYFAITCPADSLRPDSQGRPADGRTRDHDLNSCDRLQLRIDTDRDLMSSLSLEMSASGRTRDAIDGNDAWQPTWYVAPSDGESSIRFELAVLRRDLIELPIHPGQSWFVSLRRLEANESSWDHPLPQPANWLRVTFE